ncbi:MAG: zinc ribbon domain-containing protein [Lachnospiraceae bacterium]|nr:zinc ribbon domain-containing protein [Lachnospiraceae bacterium]
MILETKDKNELQKILQIGQVDVGNDTLFSRKDKLNIRKDHLTLVISSGGSGAAAIREAIRTAKQKLHSDFSTYMKFIMVDSDGNEVKHTENQVGQNTLQILNISTPGAMDRLRYDVRTDFFRKFVHKNYNVTKLGPDGSGRDRTTGKIKFYDDAQGGGSNDVRFRNMISSLFTGDWASKKNLPVDIMIMAGLSGGNGSGTFEELAAHAREACLKAGAREVRVFGYLFLPDTVEAFDASNPDILSAIYVNGYAALKELESYESIPASPGRKESFYSRDGVTEIICDDSKRLYDYPVLISGTYEESKAMMAESIINLAIESDGTFSQNSFYSNSETNRTSYLTGNNLTIGGLLKKDIFPEDSHRYSGIGYAYAAIPDQIVTANVVSNVCRKLYEVSEVPGIEGTDKDTNRVHFCTDKNRMSKFEMETQIRRLFNIDSKQDLNAMSFWDQRLKGALNKCSMLPDNHVEITSKDVSAGQVGTFEKGFHATERVNTGTPELMKYLDEQLVIFKEKSLQVIKDYGPRAMELLYKGMGPYDKDGNPQSYPDISIENMLNTAKAELQKIIAKQVPRPVMTKKFLEIVRHEGLAEWKGQFKNAVQHEVKQKIADNIIAPNGAWEKKLIQPIEEYIKQCKRFADSLEMLTNFYQSAGSSLDAQDYQKFLDASKTGNCVNLCNNANVYSWIQSQVKAKINGVDPDEVKKNIVESFAEKPSDWTSDVEGKTRGAFDAVMARSCELGSGAGGGTTITLTATSYFDFVLAQEAPENVQNKAMELVQGIVGQLLEKSKPALKCRPGSMNALNRFILIPKSLQASAFANSIISAFKSELQKISGAGAAQLSVSEAVLDIVCYQTSVANAVCDLTDIGKWEQYYNRSKEHVSRHLCNGEYVSKFTERTKTEIETEKAIKGDYPVPKLMLTAEEDMIFGTGLSWEHYPPLALHDLDKNEYEKEFLNTVFEPIVNYAMREKIIERKVTANVSSDIYQYVVNLIPKDWNNLDVTEYYEVGADGRFERGEALFEYLQSQNLISRGEKQKEITLFGSGVFEKALDFSEARRAGMNTAQIEAKSIEYMKRILRKNTDLFQEMRETLFRYYEIVRCLELREKDQKYLYQTEKFIRYYQYGLLSDAGDVWRYETDSSGKTKLLCRFDAAAEMNYSPMEKKLVKDGWKILLAFKKFTTLDFDQLERTANEKQRNEDRKSFNELLVENTEKLKKVHDKLKKDFIDPAGEDKTVEEAIRYILKVGKNDEDFYIKTLAAMWEKLPKDDIDSMSIEPGKKESTSVWVCPECRRLNEAEKKFCSECGTKKPEEKEESDWTCPNCSHVNGAKIKFCSECGTKKPEEKEESDWICPNCSHVNGAKVKFCSECGTKKPEEKLENEWICPNCNHVNGVKIKFCSECGTKKPEKTPEVDWICQNCGNSNGAKIKFCSECGTKR